MNSNRRINVLFVTRRFPPSIGGMERFAYDLSTCLSQKTNLHLIKWSGKNKYVHVALIPVFFVRSSWVLLTKKVDVIHMQDGVLSILGVALKFIFRKPLTVVIHGLDATHKTKLYQSLIKWSLSKADHIFCISHMAMVEVGKRGIEAKKVSVIPLGVVDDIYSQDQKAARQRVNKALSLEDSKKIVLSTGRLVKRKGVKWFVVNVMPNLVKKNRQITLVVAGGGPEQSSIVEAVNKLKLENNIRILGRINHDLLIDLYNASDVFVMPNIKVRGDMEGFGRVLVEAALSKLPVVASGIEGITDAIVNGKNGILVKSKDAVAFESKILEFINNPVKANQFGKKARKYSLENFNWDKIAEQYVNEYKRLVN